MLKYEKDKEKAAFKEMTFKQKVEHIREYYTLHIIIGLVVAYLLGWGLNHYIINPPKKPTVNVTFHSYEVSQDAMKELEAELPEVFPEYYSKKYEIQTDSIPTSYDMGEMGINAPSVTKLVANIESRSIDLMIGDMTCLGSDAYNSYLMPLYEVFTEEELAEIEKLGYVQEDADSPIIEISPGDINEYGYEYLLDPEPFLVDLSGNQALRTITNGEPTYVGFVANTKHLDEAKELFWYFLTGERKGSY